MDECNQADDRAVVNATLDKFLSEATAPLRSQLADAERLSETRKMNLEQCIDWLVATAEILWPTRKERHFKDIPAEVRSILRFAEEMRPQSIKFDGERQRAEKEAENWKRLFEEEVKRQDALGEWVREHAHSGYGDYNCDVALRMLKEQADKIERQREEIARLTMKIGHLEACGQTAQPINPFLSPPLKEAMGAALTSARTCSSCKPHAQHFADVVMSALAAYDAAKARL